MWLRFALGLEKGHDVDLRCWAVTVVVRPTERHCRWSYWYRVKHACINSRITSQFIPRPEVKGKSPMPRGGNDPPKAIPVTLSTALFGYWKEVSTWFCGHAMWAIHLQRHIKGSFTPDGVGYEEERGGHCIWPLLAASFSSKFSRKLWE